MKKLIDRLELGKKFKSGSIVPLKVKELVRNLTIYDQIKALTTVEMWKNNQVPREYAVYARTMMPIYDMVHFMTWQQSKEKGIEEELDSGRIIHPIHATLNVHYDSFSITDGITRIRVFNQRGLEYIPTELYLDRTR